MMKIVTVLLLLFLPLTSGAIEFVNGGYIQSVENGWYGEGIAFKFSKPLSGCPSEDGDYAVSKDHAGYREVVSILLTAYAASSKVDLVVEKGVCLFGGRTQVISIRLVR